MIICVVGLGKIGLPLAVQYATKGHHVVGVDINADLVATINSGVEPFPGETDLARLLSSAVTAGSLSATTDYAEAVPQAETIVVVVPLHVDADGLPDFGWMDTATRDVARHLAPRTLVLYETTLPVGTTRDRWRPELEAVSGLREGRDFHVAFSPERVLTGRVFADLRKYPKLIGALSDAGAEATRHFYESALDFDLREDLPRPNGVWDLGSAEAAELAKLAETTYRDVNIGLANQFARFAGDHGIDIYATIEAANSQPYSHIHRPGISVGGHCIPVYPRLYLANDPNATIVSTAREANAAMPGYSVDLLASIAGDLAGSTVAILGAAYRGGVKETAFSGVFDLVRELTRRGADARVHDAIFTAPELRDMGLTPFELGEPAKAAIIHTDHEAYRRLTQSDLPGVEYILDGRRILRASDFPDSRIISIGLGRPESW